MTAPTPYEPPDGHIIYRLDQVPEGWEYRYVADSTVWHQTVPRQADSIFVEARPVRQPDPRGMCVYADTLNSDRDVLVTSVGEMRHRTDLDQWEYANTGWFGRWVTWDDFGGPEEFPIVVRRRVS